MIRHLQFKDTLTHALQRGDIAEFGLPAAADHFPVAHEAGHASEHADLIARDVETVRVGSIRHRSTFDVVGCDVVSILAIEVDVVSGSAHLEVQQ